MSTVRYSSLLTVMLGVWIASSEASAGMPEMKYNRLPKEKSPYLLQHATDPVWWYPWGKEAFAVAKAENKPIFLSIGYSTCYWCHFMKKDSFEKNDVAKLLNTHFISIMVDREERPDVDQIYMRALVEIQGRGGWPMNMFLTPEGKPFFGASTILHDPFVNVLTQIARAWKEEPDRIRQGGDQLARLLTQEAHPPSAAKEKLGEETLRAFYRQMKSDFDAKYGGFGSAPKFPGSMGLSALLRIHRRTGDSHALAMVKTTLDGMARGGLYDHLGGGFHRYATDAEWRVPHFEKMLYDNALLANAYLESYQVTGEREYARVARGILDYVLRDMTHPEGGFYAAEDAGDVGREGEYYVWKESELKALLAPKELARVREVYGITPEGNFENGENILFVRLGGRLPGRSDPFLERTRAKLLDARNKRQRPHLDDKILTSWNGLTIAALAKGYQVLGEERYLQAAQKAAGFVLQNFEDEKGRLLRRWREGEAKYPGYVDDYAFLIRGLIELYQSDFNPQWLARAVALQKVQDQMFWDEQAGAYFFSDGLDQTLLVRGMEFGDHALPSGNSVTALNLLQLADLTLRPELKKRADRIFAAAAGQATRYPAAFPQLLIALDYALDRSKEIAVVGSPADPKTRAIVRDIHRTFLPNKVLAVGPPARAQGKGTAVPLLENKPLIGGHTTAFVCEDGLCLRPTGDPAVIRKQAGEFKPYSLK